MRLIKWLKARRARRDKEIARAVIWEFENRPSGLEKFLPPVAMEGSLYFITERGSIYKMNASRDGFETIMQIRKG